MSRNSLFSFKVYETYQSNFLPSTECTLQAFCRLINSLSLPAISCSQVTKYVMYQEMNYSTFC